MNPPEPKKFPADGAAPRLAPCSRGGDCCRGRGRTTLDADDVRRLAAGLGLSEAAFLLSHAERFGGRLTLRTPGPDGACILLGPTGCAAYDARPAMCRTWPLWTALRDDAARFDASRARCAMLRPLSHADFRALCDEPPPT